MIVLSRTIEQTVAPGATVTFDAIPVLHTGCGECYSSMASSVKLKQNGIYEISYGANVSGATAGTPVQLSLQVGGVTIPTSTTIYTPAAANAVGPVSRTIAVKNCCCDFDRVTLVNTGTEPITIEPNLVLFVKRLS